MGLSVPPSMWTISVRGGTILLASPRDGGNEKDAITLFERAGFAAEKTNVFLVEIDIQELADLAALVADVPRETREARSEFVESFRDGRCATVDFRLAIREAAEGGGNFYRDWHC
jgi:hypothetical protein